MVGDGGQLTQLDGLQAGALGEGISAHLGDLGHIHSRQLLVAREGTRTDGGHLGIGQLEGTLDTGSHQNQGVSFLIEQVRLPGQRSEGGVARIHGEGIQGGAAEGVLTDNRHVLAQGHRGQSLTAVEGSCGHNGGVDGNGGQSLTARESVTAQLDLLGGDLHRGQGRTAREGVCTHGLGSGGKGHALQGSIAEEGVVRQSHHAVQLDRALQGAVREGVLVDELDTAQTLHQLEGGTAIERALVDALQGGGQNHTLQSG